MTKLLSAKNVSHTKIALSLINSEIDRINAFKFEEIQSNVFSHINYLRNKGESTLVTTSIDSAHKIKFDINSSEDLDRLQKSIKKLQRIKFQFIRGLFKEVGENIKTNKALIKAINYSQKGQYYQFINYTNKFKIREEIKEIFYNRILKEDY